MRKLILLTIFVSFITLKPASACQGVGSTYDLGNSSQRLAEINPYKTHLFIGQVLELGEPVGQYEKGEKPWHSRVKLKVLRSYAIFPKIEVKYIVADYGSSICNEHLKVGQIGYFGVKEVNGTQYLASISGF